MNNLQNHIQFHFYRSKNKENMYINLSYFIKLKAWTIQCTLVAHLSYPAAHIGHPPLESKAEVSHLRELSSEAPLLSLPLSDLISCLLLHGCQVASTAFDVHISEMRSCPTVRSKDRSPNSIFSRAS
ncbi:hypothetical protein C1H46_001691 [Malus baccata]|uniref:Uncharacterized protein n=1 Tax=Malus baccata TaxID=106549 RepID=A0A540NNS9_MALBA|nr:hypothetical protein C1H46_001691 [Malus baccata]